MRSFLAAFSSVACQWWQHVAITLQGKDLADLVNDSAGGEAKGSAGGRPRAGARKSGGKVLLTSTTLQAIREVVQEFFARVPKTKCANCGANSPNVKKQGFTKLFKVCVEVVLRRCIHLVLGTRDLHHWAVVARVGSGTRSVRAQRQHSA